MAFIKRSVVDVSLAREEIPAWLDAKALVLSAQNAEMPKAETSTSKDEVEDEKKED